MSQENNENLELDEDYGPDILTLVDDEDNEHEFELLHELEEDGKTYYALLPTEKELQESGEEDGVYYIFEVLNRGDEDQELVEVYDEPLLDKLSAKFEAYFDEMFAEEE